VANTPTLENLLANCDVPANDDGLRLDRLQLMAGPHFTLAMDLLANFPMDLCYGKPARGGGYHLQPMAIELRDHAAKLIEALYEASHRGLLRLENEEEHGTDDDGLPAITTATESDIELGVPIFIVGLPRTGTSLLQDLFAMDPQTCAVVFVVAIVVTSLRAS